MWFKFIFSMNRASSSLCTRLLAHGVGAGVCHYCHADKPGREGKGKGLAFCFGCSSYNYQIHYRILTKGPLHIGIEISV